MAKSKQQKQLEADFRVARADLVHVLRSQANFLSYMKENYPYNEENKWMYENSEIQRFEVAIKKHVEHYKTFPVELQMTGLDGYDDIDKDALFKEWSIGV